MPRTGESSQGLIPCVGSLWLGLRVSGRRSTHVPVSEESSKVVVDYSSPNGSQWRNAFSDSSSSVGTCSSTSLPSFLCRSPWSTGPSFWPVVSAVSSPGSGAQRPPCAAADGAAGSIGSLAAGGRGPVAGLIPAAKPFCEAQKKSSQTETGPKHNRFHCQ